MSETGRGSKPPLSGKGKLAALVIVVLLGLAALYGAMTHIAKPGGSLKPLATGAMAKLKPVDPPAPPPAKPFEGPGGRPMRVADLEGKVVLVNLWATWCAPCVKEMPTLARLQQAYAGKPVVIVPISVDRGDDVAKARAFIGQHAPLVFHHVETDWVFGLDPPAQGFPTTIIFDRQGRERGRVAGDADWTSAEARKVIDHLLSEPSEPNR
jgi:thiol-disulfide isomerase/thioredoxin